MRRVVLAGGAFVVGGGGEAVVGGGGEAVVGCGGGAVVVGGMGSVTRDSSRCRIPNVVKHSEQPECFRYGESSHFHAKVDTFTSLSAVRSLTRFFNALRRASFSYSGIWPFSSSSWWSSAPNKSL